MAIDPAWAAPPTAHYTLTMRQAQAQLHSQLPPTTVWGYKDAAASTSGILGPTFVVRTGEPIAVTFKNELPATHLFESSIDWTIAHMEDEPELQEETRAVTHLHGGHVATTSDGGPDDWFFPGAIAATFHYPNNQEAATALVPRSRDGHHPAQPVRGARRGCTSSVTTTKTRSTSPAGPAIPAATRSRS